MVRSFPWMIPLLVSSVGLAIDASAQQFGDRQKGVALAAYADVAGDIGSVSLAYNTSGELELVWLPPERSAVKMLAPFPVGGDIAPVGEGRFLVSGFTPAGPATARRGHLLDVTVQADPSAIVVHASMAYERFDFTNLVERDGLLYALDWRSRTLFAAPWTGSLPPESAFIAIADPQTLPMLRGPVELEVWRTFDGGGSNGVLVVNSGCMEGEPVSATVKFVGTGFTVTPRFTRPPEPQWSFSNWLANGNGPTIDVHGLVGARGACAIEDVAGHTLASGVVDASGFAALAIPRGKLVPGAVYRVTGANGAVSPWQTINSSWGRRTQGDLVLRREIVDELFVGNGEFDVTMRAEWVADTPRRAHIESYLVIGFQDRDAGNVTISSTTGVATITNAAAIVGPMPMPIDSEHKGAAAVRIPVTAGPGAAGIEVLFQWIGRHGSSWSYSDVHGSRLFDAPATFVQSMTKSAAVAAEPESSKVARAMAQRWLDGAKFIRPTPGQLAVLREAIVAAQQ